MEIPLYELCIKDCEFYLYKSRSIQCEKYINASNAGDIADFMCKEFRLNRLAQEEVYALYLNTKLKISAIALLSKGSIDEAHVSNQSLFRIAFMCNAIGIVLVHNHPSGGLDPSKADLQTTKELKSGCELLGLNLYDHIIIGNGFTSLFSRGLLK